MAKDPRPFMNDRKSREMERVGREEGHEAMVEALRAHWRQKRKEAEREDEKRRG